MKPAVAVAEAGEHAPLLVPREQVVEEQHDGEEDEREEPRPQDGEAEPRHGKGEVLRVADHRVEAPRRGPRPEELARVDLDGAGEEDGDAHDERHGPEHPDGAQGRIG